MVEAIKHFDFYLAGKSFDLITDSKALFYLKNAKESNPKLYRWSLLLQNYDFTLIHVKSHQNVVPDVLSRQNEILQRESRQIHTAKKDIMEAIRSRLNKIKLPEEFCLSSKQVTRILAESSNIHIAEKISDSINMASEDLADASLLAAISIQPGRLPIETLAALQKQDAACNKLRADVPRNFTVKSDVLLRVRNEHSESLLTPQIVLPDILVPLVI